MVNKTKKQTQTKTKVKATNRKSAPKKNEAVESQVVKEDLVMKFMNNKSWQYGLVAVMLVLAVAIYYKSWIVAVFVNGQPISRMALVSELEKQYGNEALENLITERLIMQEVSKKGLTVDEAMIDSEVEVLQGQIGDQSIEEVLVLQGMTMEDLRQQIKLQLLIEELVASESAVTREAVTSYIAENQNLLPTDLSEEEVMAMVEDQLKRQEIQQRFSSWLDQARQNAKIDYWINL